MAKKIIKSIKKRPINLILVIVVVCLYFINNTLIKPNTLGMVHIFFVSYFNDLMCPYFFLGYANMLLITCSREMATLKVIFIVGMTAGLTWEFIAPFLKKSSVTDPLDIVCYAISTVGYWAVLNAVINRKGKGNA